MALEFKATDLNYPYMVSVQSVTFVMGVVVSLGCRVGDWGGRRYLRYNALFLMGAGMDRWIGI